MAKTSKPSWTSSFKLAADPVKQRIIGLSIGEVGTGKTSFWLSAPGPIAIFSLDLGLEGVVEQFQEDKEIFVWEKEWLPNDEDENVQQDAIALRQEFEEQFEQAIQHARTVILDKETNFWELYRYAEFGGPSEAPRNYPALNQRYRRMLNLPKGTDINFGIIESMKDEWVTKKTSEGSKGAQTGRRVRKGFDEADEIVHTVLLHTREGGEMSYTVGKSRGPGSRDVQDVTFPVPEPKEAFTGLATNLFPETSEDDWS